MTFRRKAYTALAIVSLVIVAVGGVTLLSAGASAGQGGVLDDGKELLPRAAISLDEAIAAARTAASGPLDEIDLEYFKGRLVFNIDVGDKDVRVDAETGVVVDVSSDD